MRKNATLSPWSGSSGLASEIDRTPFELLTSGAAGAVLHGVDPLPQSGSTVSGADAWLARRPLGPVSYAWTVYVYDADGFGGLSRQLVASTLCVEQTSVVSRKTS